MVIPHPDGSAEGRNFGGRPEFRLAAGNGYRGEFWPAAGLPDNGQTSGWRPEFQLSVGILAVGRGV